MDLTLCINYAIQILGLIVSIIACAYTIKTYNKSSDILDVVDSERTYRWNKKQLEELFTTLPFDCIDSFFSDPTIIRNEMYQGLRSIDLSTFQFRGEEKTLITQLINRLEEFCSMNYKQTPSKHWKYAPLAEYEEFDEEIEMQRINDLHEKTKTIKPLYAEIKEILSKYHIDLKELNRNARELYQAKENSNEYLTD